MVEAAERDSIPIIAELRQLGIQISSLAELVSQSIDYREAIPVLLKWLQRVENAEVKETLVRALTTKWGKPIAARPLIEEFVKAPLSDELGLKWAIANALAEVADESVFDEVVQLAQDKRHARSREMLALALARMNEPNAVDVLIGLLGDEEMTGHALMGLQILAPPHARAAIEPFVNHPRTWVRKEAKRALARIDKGHKGRTVTG